MGEGAGRDRQQAPDLARRMRPGWRDGLDERLRLLPARAAGRNLGRPHGRRRGGRRLLAVELGAYPSPETESIYRDLLQWSPADGPATALPALPKISPGSGAVARCVAELPPPPRARDGNV